MSTYSRNSSLATALRTLEDYAFAGFTLEGDDIPRLRATVDRLAPVPNACSHSWNDYGHHAGKNLVYCSRCKMISATSSEGVPYGMPR